MANNTDFVSIALSYVTLPVAWFNITSSSNTWKINFRNYTTKVSTGSISGVIPPGFYTVSTLLTALNASSATVVWSFNSLYGKLSFYIIGHTTDEFTFDGTSSNLALEPHAPGNTCYNQLGVTQYYFDNWNIVYLAGAITYSLLACVDLSGTKSIGIQFLGIPSEHRVSFDDMAGYPLIASIPCTNWSEFGDMIEYEPHTQYIVRSPAIYFDQLRVTLLDDRGYQLQLNNCHWCIGFSLSLEKV